MSCHPCDLPMLVFLSDVSFCLVCGHILSFPALAVGAVAGE